MPLVAGGVLLGGYALSYYALSQLLGGNWGLLDMVVPGRWNATTQAVPRDGEKPAKTSTTQTSYTAGTQATSSTASSASTKGTWA